MDFVEHFGDQKSDEPTTWICMYYLQLYYVYDCELWLTASAARYEILEDSA